MFETKYSKFLTIVLVVIIVAIIALGGYLGYSYFESSSKVNDADKYVSTFVEEVANTTNNTNPFDQITSNTTSSSSGTKRTYKGFGMLGTMEIPATKFKYPVLEKVTKKSIETAVAFQWGAGLNQPGNSVIIGHNYRNGMFFSNNKKLKNGDKIYITDNSGKKLTYTIYDKFETSDTDTSFYQRDTEGKAEITLSTCTDDSKARLIILAKAE